MVFIVPAGPLPPQNSARSIPLLGGGNASLTAFFDVASILPYYGLSGQASFGTSASPRESFPSRSHARSSEDVSVAKRHFFCVLNPDAKYITTVIHKIIFNAR